MKLRILLVLGVSAIVAQDALAARPRHKRPATPSSKGAVVQNSAAFVPQKTGTQLNATDQTPPASTVESDPEQVRYEQAKARAKEDPEVKTLKAKADQATSAEESRRTSVAYNRMLFRKMRQIDRSVAERADLVEAAILKRINE